MYHIDKKYKIIIIIIHFPPSNLIHFFLSPSFLHPFLHFALPFINYCFPV